MPRLIFFSAGSLLKLGRRRCGRDGRACGLVCGAGRPDGEGQKSSWRRGGGPAGAAGAARGVGWYSRVDEAEEGVRRAHRQLAHPATCGRAGVVSAVAVRR